MADCRFNIDFRDIPSIPEMLKDYLDGNLSAYHGLQFSKDNSLAQANKKIQKLSFQTQGSSYRGSDEADAKYSY